MIHDSPSFPDFADTPKVENGAVNKGHACDNGERPSSGEGEGVAEIEESGGDGADEDGEFEPGEEGAFGGELDFGFDADGDVDACQVLDYTI
jgi:hypothetical protein